MFAPPLGIRVRPGGGDAVAIGDVVNRYDAFMSVNEVANDMGEIIGGLHAALDKLYALDPTWRDLGAWSEDTTGSRLLDAATEAELSAAEARLGQAFPPSYREFLRRHAGWEHFWGDDTLVGTGRDETQRALDEIAENVDEQAADLKRRLGELTAEAIAAWEQEAEDHLHLASHLVIATDFGGELWVYDLRTRRPDGEMTIVKWTIDSGMQEEPKFQTFHEFLEWNRSEIVARLAWTEERIANPSKAVDDDD